jgi:hypothetical protein
MDLTPNLKPAAKLAGIAGRSVRDQQNRRLQLRSCLLAISVRVKGHCKYCLTAKEWNMEGIARPETGRESGLGDKRTVV